MNLAVLGDDVAGRHWQCPGIIAVVSFEVDSERAVNLAQFIRQSENQAEFLGECIVLVNQDRYCQVEFLNLLPGKLGPYRGDGQQGGTAFKNGLVIRLQSFQLRVAVRSPGPAVEGEDQRAIGQYLP